MSDIKQYKYIKDVNLPIPELCPYCGKKSDKWEIDHIVSKHNNGINAKENLIVVCKQCNRKKHKHDLLDVFSEEDLSDEVLEMYKCAKYLCNMYEDKYPKQKQKTFTLNEDEYWTLARIAVDRKTSIKELVYSTVLELCEKDKSYSYKDLQTKDL